MNESFGSEMPILVMADGRTHTRWMLKSEMTVIGRDPESDILIPDRQISRRHAEIYRSGDGFVLRDCGSKNGTFVNGDRLTEEIRLEDGDEIQLALCCQLIFVGPGATAPLVLEEGDLQPVQLDEKAHRVWVRGQEIDPPLSVAQFRLLSLLCEDPGRAFSREEIIQAVWPGEEGEGITEQALDALVRRLRERLAEYGGQELVATVRGHGFRLNADAGF